MDAAAGTAERRMIMAICNNKKCSLGECDQAETCTAYVPVITNADRIRAMGDEELAKWIDNFFWGNKKVNLFDILKWLQQPAEGCDHGE